MLALTGVDYEKVPQDAERSVSNSCWIFTGEDMVKG